MKIRNSQVIAERFYNGLKIIKTYLGERLIWRTAFVDTEEDSITLDSSGSPVDIHVISNTKWTVE